MFEQKHNSKGNQTKIRLEDGSWLKLDFLGYESLVEFIVSCILKRSNFDYYVQYTLGRYHDKYADFVCCISKDFKKENEIEITLYELFMKFRGVDLYLEIENPLRSTEDCIMYIVNEVEDITGVKKFGIYFTVMLELDAFFLNEDRHLNNITFLYNTRTDEFRLAPLFDFGGSLLSDTKLYYHLGRDIEECISEVKSKPISPDFDEQLNACHSLYGSYLKFNFTEYYVDSILNSCREYYSDEVINRVKHILLIQMNKYKVIFKPVDTVYERFPKERYIVGRNPNTKDWFVYDNLTDRDVYLAETEDEANDYIRLVLL